MVAGPHLTAMAVQKVRRSAAYERLRRTGQNGGDGAMSRRTDRRNWPDIPWGSGGHAARVRQNAALTSFAAWFGNALRAAEPGPLHLPAVAVKPSARRPPRR